MSIQTQSLPLFSLWPDGRCSSSRRGPSTRTVDRSVSRTRWSGSDPLSSGKHVYPAAFWTRQNSHLLKGEPFSPRFKSYNQPDPSSPCQTKQRETILQQFGHRKIGLAFTPATRIVSFQAPGSRWLASESLHQARRSHIEMMS